MRRQSALAHFVFRFDLDPAARGYDDPADGEGLAEFGHAVDGHVVNSAVA
jgi:hypothetical protein